MDPLALAIDSSCPLQWLPTFGEPPGTGGSVSGIIGGDVFALAVYDDGNGPALYAGGAFSTAGGVGARVAKWDGSSWSAVAIGGFGIVNALAVYDDGSGPALYAGGEAKIAKWDGSSWSAVGGTSGGYVFALAVHDDGSGPALYAGGGFIAVGGVSANRIAKWDGSSWSALGSGMNDWVNALAVYDDGGGPALYAGGSFARAGNVAANRIAKWDGSGWSALGTGMSGQYNFGGVTALAVYDDGGGPALYAGGYFTTAGGVAANRIAKWDGSSWSPLGSGMTDSACSLFCDVVVYALAVHDDGGGPALYAGGRFTSAGGVAANGIAKWDGSSWSTLGSGMSPELGDPPASVNALAAYDAGTGPALYAGGDFESAGGVVVDNIAKWENSSWSELGSGMNGDVHALTVHDDGSGRVLYAGGSFTAAGGVPANRIAKWDGSSWSALGTGMSNSFPSDASVLALAVYDDGGGPALYAGGDFARAGGVTANGIAKWDGASWSPLGSGLFFSPFGLDLGVETLAVHDDGSGQALYAGGSFTVAGGVPANRIARWDGSRWSALGSGMSGAFGFARVYVLAVYDDGGGQALYAGGDFTSAGGVATNRIARWDGSSWFPLGSGLNDVVQALAVHDDGGGPALYAGGRFTSAGGLAANRIAKWDGGSWSPLGSGINHFVFSLTSHDDGGGPALYAGGRFTIAGGMAANHIARWDGSSWSPLGSGMSNPDCSFCEASVYALAVHDDGGGPALYAGGGFRRPFDSGDSYLAKWGCPVVAEQCVQGLGHWKTHACDWPAPFVPGAPDPTDADGNGVADDVEGQCGVRGNAPDSQCPCDALHTITIGSIAYDQCELLCSLAQPVQGNALRLLARQLIAAKLNVLNGASDDGVVQASCAGLPPNPYDGYTVAGLIAAGDKLIATGTTDGSNTFACAGTANCSCPAFPANILTDCVPTSAAHGNTLGPAMTAVAQLLELYGEGCGGVPRCIPAQFLQDEHEPRRR